MPPLLSKPGKSPEVPTLAATRPLLPRGQCPTYPTLEMQPWQDKTLGHHLQVLNQSKGGREAPKAWGQRTLQAIRDSCSQDLPLMGTFLPQSLAPKPKSTSSPRPLLAPSRSRNQEEKCPDLAVSLQGEVLVFHWYFYFPVGGRHYTPLPVGIFRKPPAPHHCAQTQWFCSKKLIRQGAKISAGSLGCTAQRMENTPAGDGTSTWSRTPVYSTMAPLGACWISPFMVSDSVSLFPTWAMSSPDLHLLQGGMWHMKVVPGSRHTNTHTSCLCASG